MSDAKCSKPGCGALRIIGKPCTDWDCPQATVDAHAFASLKARFDAQVDYAIDLQRIIEDLCHSREITVPQSGARFHYDMAVAHLAALSQDTPSLPLKPQEAVKPAGSTPHSAPAGTNSEAQV